jgi:hypothetical protein
MYIFTRLFITCWLVFLVLPVSLAGCSSGEVEAGLLGTWEGTIPIPATHEEMPVLYHFREDGLTITVGEEGQETSRTWPRWTAGNDVEGDISIKAFDDSGRVYHCLAQERGDGSLLLWDRHLSDSTAAHVTRQETSPEHRATTAEPEND